MENLQLSLKINHCTVDEYIRVTKIDLHWVAQQKGKTINVNTLRKMFSEQDGHAKARKVIDKEHLL